MIKEEDLQDISRALTHMLFRNVPLVEEIQMLLKHIEFSSVYGRGSWESERKVEV